VITDITMPRMDGLKLLEAIKASYAGTEVIMITGNIELEYAIQALREGAYDYFPKPFHFDKISLTIDRVLEKRRLMAHKEELVRLKGQLKSERRAAWQMVRGLALAVEAKDQYTSGHSDRVARVSRLLGQEMGLRGRELDALTWAGLLHDIGKIGVPGVLLNKTEKLTEAEFEVIKGHPALGAKMLEPVSFLRSLIPGVRHHHENWDGTGYPDGLKGEEIPLQARIVKVADAYDSIREKRPYREALGDEAVIRIFREHYGTQFAPDALDVFFRLHAADPELGSVDLPTPENGEIEI
jgi:putative nucleotidyltransferase with HDIG domain